MPRRRIHPLLSLAFGLTVAGCGGGTTDPATGSLALEVSGLPAGVAADIDVSGPNGYHRQVGAAETLGGLTLGTYTLVAADVSADGTGYAASPPSQSVTVSDGDPVGAAVAYTPLIPGTGSLAVAVNGLPGGTDAAVTVSGPGGYSHQVVATETLTDLSAGQYTLTALPVTAGSDQYTPAPTSQTASVALAIPASATVSYSTGGAAGFNLGVAGVYLVQSVQTPGRTIPLIRDRDALLRVFVTANQVNAAAPAVRVRFYSGATLLATETISAPGLATPLSADEGDLGKSWNLAVDGSLLQSNLSLLIEVDPDNQIAEGDESDNVFPSTGTPLALDVRTAAPFEVMLVPVVTKGDGRQGNVNSANRQDYFEATMRMHPIAAYDATVHGAYQTSANTVLGSDGGPSWNSVLQEIDALRLAENSSRYYYGVVNPNYQGGIAGMGYISRPTAIGWDKVNSRASVAAHEWGHNWGRKHAPCGGVSGADPNYPYSGGVIGVVGYDMVAQDLKPADSHDLMGYCNDDWISDYTYLGVMNFRESDALKAGGMAAAVQPALLVWGRIEGGRAVLEPAFRVTARPSLPREPGPYSIEGRSADGGRIFGLDFAPVEVGDDPNGAKHFAFTVPLPPSRAARLASLHLAGGGVQASLASPATGPVAVEASRSVGGMTLRWDASKAPMVMVRDPVTGQVLAFARGGRAEIPTTRGELSVTVSDRVQSRDLRVKPR